ncbi:MAG: hypothetical protein V4525_04410 [Pseudomonadota bacterium]
MVNSLEPKWQPLSTLSLFSDYLDTQLEDVRNQYDALLSVQSRPHILDDAMITRIMDVYTEQQKCLSVFKEQAIRWRYEAKTYDQQASVDFLNSQIHQIEVLSNYIFDLTKQLSGKNIYDIHVKTHSTFNSLAKSNSSLHNQPQ